MRASSSSYSSRNAMPEVCCVYDSASAFRHNNNVPTMLKSFSNSVRLDDLRAMRDNDADDDYDDDDDEDCEDDDCDDEDCEDDDCNDDDDDYRA